MSGLIFAPFYAVAVVHLVACFFKNPKVANVTKILLMPVLAVCMVLHLKAFPVYLVFALLFGCAGDYFLLRPVTKHRFLYGIFAFFMGHCFYLLLLIPRSEYWILPEWFVLLFMAVAFAIVFAIWKIIKLPKDLRGFGCVIYTLMLLLVNFITLSGVASQFVAQGSLSAIPREYYLALAGNLIFIVSDSILCITIFMKDFKYSRFVVMITYIVAEYLLAISVC